jgi:hypothetical protein
MITKNKNSYSSAVVKRGEASLSNIKSHKLPVFNWEYLTII